MNKSQARWLSLGLSYWCFQMKLFYTDQFHLPLPADHRFPMSKYTLLRERILQSGLIEPADLWIPHAATDEELLRAHCPEYLRRVTTGRLSPAEIRRIGFPWSPELVERSRRSSGATIEACRAALADGLAVNLAGGTHHAFRDCGEGFCVFNDSVIAARAMQAENRVEKVLIIDCDVHQGNGTARILRDDPSIFTFSIHGAKNFPLRKEHSDLDIAVPAKANDLTYLSALEAGLTQILSRTTADLAIYLAGADPFQEDRFGTLSVSKQGLAKRDQMVFDFCRKVDLPVVTTMAGGYAPEVTDIVDIHFQTVAEAIRRGNQK